MKSKATEKASFYHQLGNLLAGGVGLRIALKTLSQHLPNSHLKKIAKDLLTTVEKGQPFHSAVAQQKDWFEVLEISLFEAGEKSGQLSEISHRLSEYWALRAETERQFFLAIAYPFFLIHFAFFTNALLQGSLLGFLNQFIASLGIFYAIIMGGVLLWRFSREAWQIFLVRFRWLRTPLLAGALYRFIFALRLQLQAAVPLLEAMSVAFQASDQPTLKVLANPVMERLKEGISLTEALEPVFLFFPYLKSFFATGETSGKILETLQFVENYLVQQWQESLKNLGRWLARLVYFLILLYIAMQIISFYSNYYKGLTQDL